MNQMKDIDEFAAQYDVISRMALMVFLKVFKEDSVGVLDAIEKTLLTEYPDPEGLKNAVSIYRDACNKYLEAVDHTGLT